MAAPCFEALNEQLALIRFWQSQHGAPFAAKVLDELKKGQFGRMIGDWTPEDLSKTEAERLNVAETYFVRTDMGELAARTSQSRSLIPQPLKDYHLPTPTGFAYFQNEILLPYTFDTESGVIPIKAALWRPTTITVGEWPSGERVLGVALSFYESREGWSRRTGKPIVPGVTPKLMLHATHGWPFDVDWYGEDFDRDAKEFTKTLSRDAELRRFMTAFWSHLQTTVYVMTDEITTDRTTKKHAVRAGFAGKLDSIRVIVLRKKYNKKSDDNNGTGAKREFAFRHIRVGHWRNQWYPSQHQHHQIWIDETIVGDESLPFDDRDRIYDWKR